MSHHFSRHSSFDARKHLSRHLSLGTALVLSFTGAVGFAATSMATAASMAVDATGTTKSTFRVTRPSPFAADCSGDAETGTNYPNAEVEPFVANNPLNPWNVVGVWQQDRWSDGGSHGVGTGYSFDGGQHWHRLFLPFSHCAGGNAGNGGDFDRASDPWVSFSPNGTVHVEALAIRNPDILKPGSAVLVSRSLDGGRNWSPTTTLVADTAERFNDKNSITADATDSRYVYAVWDRLSTVVGEGAGPTLLARSVDNGASWEPTHVMFDPGVTAQTIGNRIEVLPSGRVVNQFALIDYIAGTTTATAMVSDDKGATWSAPIKVGDILSVGTADPTTGAPIRTGSGLPQLAASPDGTLYSVWSDARFSGGVIDGIALSKSTNGGQTWSEPVQINRDTSVAAFTPTVHVRGDGSVGVSYFDFRSDTSDRRTLPTDTWLVVSRDGGSTWRESNVTPSFDILRAPFAGGFFVGDYQGMVSIGKGFVPFFAKTTEPSGTKNRTDVYARWMVGGASADDAIDAAERALPTYAALQAAPQAMQRAAEAQPRVWQATRKMIEDRLPGWFQRPAALSVSPTR